MAKQLPTIPQDRKNDVPRCPLCGIVLDSTVDILELGAGTGTLTLTPKSLAHVAQPHTLTITPAFDVRQRDGGDWAVFRIATGETSAVTPSQEVAEQLRDRWNNTGRMTL